MAIMPQFDSYIICGTPRTGSTLLCDLMAATKVAGVPDSFFMRDVDPVWAAEWGLPEEQMDEPARSAAHLAAAVAAGRGTTAIFGLRLMRENLGDLCAMIDRVHPGLPSDRSRLAAAFGRILFIHLARGDKLAQAISMVKAEQTGLWHIAPDGTELERLSEPRPPEFDRARIAAKLAELQSFDDAWLTWFAAEGITPLTVTYEALADAPGQAVGRICAELGVPPPPTSNLRPGVGKMADDVSRDWKERFLAGTEPG